jgi:phosphatidylserine decarboxylase
MNVDCETFGLWRKLYLSAEAAAKWHHIEQNHFRTNKSFLSTHDNNVFQIIAYYYIAALWGKLLGLLSHVYIPRILRPIIIGWYSWRTSSRNWEAVKPIEEFNNIYEFFTREIRPRPIDHRELVAPADCAITSVGELSKVNWRIEQIKGITYPVADILGLHKEELEQFKKLKNLQFVSIHLPISECHRFRSPVDWHVERRFHIPGTMYHLHHQNMFNYPLVFYNERVVLEGTWKHGKFYFIAFGSSRVGSIVIDFDKKLTTNVMGESFRKEEEGEVFKALEFNGLKTHGRIKDIKDVHLKKGEEFGHFQGGSAFVMIFQHDKIRWCVSPPQFMMYGNPLCENA